MTEQFFVTGIGTDIGKTFCTAALLHQAPQFRAVKPIMSGYDSAMPEASDAATLLSAMGDPITPQGIEAISPYRFEAPLSPHLAAAKEGKEIDVDALLDWCKAQLAQSPHLLIEGVGGVMVPITPQWRVLEWMRALDLPVMVIAGSYLGAINHTLLTLEVLKQAGLRLQAVIVSQSEACVGLQQTAATIASFLPEATYLGCVSRIKHWKDASDLLACLA